MVPLALHWAGGCWVRTVQMRSFQTIAPVDQVGARDDSLRRNWTAAMRDKVDLHQMPATATPSVLDRKFSNLLPGLVAWRILPACLKQQRP